MNIKSIFNNLLKPFWKLKKKSLFLGKETATVKF